MPKARKPSSVTDRVTERRGVLKTLRSALYPQALSDKLDKLTETIAGLTSQLENKEIKITALEERVERLEGECDRLEQYSRGGNLRFSGIPETGEGEDTTAKVVDIINTKMALTPPPPPQEDILVSHRLGKRSDTGDRRRVVIVRFNKVTVRDGVIRARRRLRNNDSTEPIYINEDLTQRRAALAAATRQMKKTHTINDCWTYKGKIVIKTLTNVIKVINTEAEIVRNMNVYQNQCLSYECFIYIIYFSLLFLLYILQVRY